MTLDQKIKVVALLEKLLPVIIGNGEGELEDDIVEMLCELNSPLPEMDFPDPSASLRAMKEQFESAKPM